MWLFAALVLHLGCQVLTDFTLFNFFFFFFFD